MKSLLLNQIKAFLFFAFLSFSLSAQYQYKIDSLKSRLRENPHDTIRAKIMSNLGRMNFFAGDYKEMLNWSSKSAEIAEKNGMKRILPGIYNMMGSGYLVLSDYPKGLEYLQKSMDAFKSRGDTDGVASIYNNIGLLYQNLGDYPKAIENMQKSLKIREQRKEQYSIAACIGNISAVYGELSEDSLSMLYQKRSFDMHEKMNNQRDMVSSLNNLCAIYLKKKDYKKALECLNRALGIIDQMESKDQRALIYSAMGNVYNSMRDYPKALETYIKIKPVVEEQGDQKQLAGLYNFMAIAQLSQKQDRQAEENYLRAYGLGEKLNLKVEQREAAAGLYQLYKQKGDLKNALHYHEEAARLNDSIYNASKNESLNSLKTQFALDRQEVSLKAKADEELKKKEAEKARQRVVIYAAMGGLLLVLVFSYFLYQRFRLTSRQNQIIAKQKLIVEQKNKEVTDSIVYAKRLQQAIIPPEEMVLKIFPDSFIFFQPKDIIAGDFYWLEDHGDSYYLAAADCTGHGVPGAIVSVVCSNALNRALKEYNMLSTGNILDKARELVLETFAKSGEVIKDGMDISLIRIKKSPAGNSVDLEWSGANNSLWYIEDNQIRTVKCDKQPIGKTDHAFPFTTHRLKMKKGSRAYLYTDGFADQFGGPKGKKFKYKPMEDLLLKIHSLPGREQQRILERNFAEWKGQLEQIDDVSVIGLVV
jgi:tetratricopeptide (TPR) repeat protein